MTRRGVDAASITPSPAGQGQAAATVPGAGGAASPDSAGRALSRKAGMHSQIAVRVSELIQGNAAEREDLRRRLAVLEVPGGPPIAAASAAALTHEIATLDRIIAWQARTAAWHVSEARRLWDAAARRGRPASPRAGSGAQERRNLPGGDSRAVWPCRGTVPREQARHDEGRM